MAAKRGEPAAQPAFAVRRAWEHEGYEGGMEDSLILVDGQRIGGAYHCSYNPQKPAARRSPCWASYGPRGYSFGHRTRKAAEAAQVREYVTNPDLFDRMNAQDRAEREAAEATRIAAAVQRQAELAAARRRERLGDDEPGPSVWTLPACHVFYAGMAEVGAVAAWLAANGIDDDLCAWHAVRVEQRAARLAIVYESLPPLALLARAMDQGATPAGEARLAETRVVTLVTEPPEITTPARPDLLEVFAVHYPARFPLIDSGETAACARCTRDARATVAERMAAWPCAVATEAIGRGSRHYATTTTEG